jgi:hypothetical protein
MSSSLAVVLLLRQQDSELDADSTATSIIFTRPVQILMPNDLCDNMQSTLMYYFETFRQMNQPNRKTWFDRIERLRSDMRDAGCG